MRENFASRLGFILAASGSAVGLGNIWRFPYLVGQNGGAAFVLIYVVCFLLIGYPLLLAEMSIGRRGAAAPIRSYATQGNHKAYGYIGAFTLLTAFLVYCFYVIIAGWTIAYTFKMISWATISTGVADNENVFNTFISSPYMNIGYGALFSIISSFIVVGGVKKGLELANKLLMPLLFVLLAIVTIRSMTLENASIGINYFFKPDFSKITMATVAIALSQMFFALSIGMGAMLIYASYLNKKECLPCAAGWVTGVDLAVGIISGLMIMPAVFAFGFNPGAGIGLTFITMPAVFSSMPFGQFFGVLFFFLLMVAALTSSISVLEPLVASLMEKTKISRKMATILISAVAFLISVPYALTISGSVKFTGVIGWFFANLDGGVVDACMLISGFLMTIFAGWKLGNKLTEEFADGKQPITARYKFLLQVWLLCLRVIFPAIIALLFLGRFHLI